MAPDVGSTPRHIRRRISGYVAADVTPVAGQQTSKMWNYFFPRPLNIYRWLDDKDKEIANGFNNLKRSNAYYLLAYWVRSRWLTLQEFNGLSEDTKAKVLLLAGIDQYTPPGT